MFSTVCMCISKVHVNVTCRSYFLTLLSIDDEAAGCRGKPPPCDPSTNRVAVRRSVKSDFSSPPFEMLAPAGRRDLHDPQRRRASGFVDGMPKTPVTSGMPHMIQQMHDCHVFQSEGAVRASRLFGNPYDTYRRPVALLLCIGVLQASQSIRRGTCLSC